MKSVTLSPPFLVLLALALATPWIIVFQQSDPPGKPLATAAPPGDAMRILSGRMGNAEAPLPEVLWVHEEPSLAEEADLLSESALDQLMVTDSVPIDLADASGDVWTWDDEGNATMLPLTLADLAGGDLDEYPLDDLEAMERDLEARQKELDELEIRLAWEADSQVAHERWLAEQEALQAESSYWVSQQWIPWQWDYYSSYTPYYCYQDPYSFSYWAGPIILVDHGFRKPHHRWYFDHDHHPRNKKPWHDKDYPRDGRHRGDDWRREDLNRNRHLVGDERDESRGQRSGGDGLGILPQPRQRMATETAGILPQPRQRMAAETARRDDEITELGDRTRAQHAQRGTAQERDAPSSSVAARRPQPRAEQSARAMQVRRETAERERRQQLAEQQRRQNLADLQLRAAEQRRRQEIAVQQQQQAEQQRRIDATRRGRLVGDIPGTSARAASRGILPSSDGSPTSRLDTRQVPTPSGAISRNTRSVPRAAPTTRSRATTVPAPTTRSRATTVPAPSRTASRPVRNSPTPSIARPTVPQPRTTARASRSTPSVAPPAARPAPRATARPTPRPTARATPSASSSSRSTRGGPFRR